MVVIDVFSFIGNFGGIDPHCESDGTTQQRNSWSNSKDPLPPFSRPIELRSPPVFFPKMRFGKTRFQAELVDIAVYGDTGETRPMK